MRKGKIFKRRVLSLFLAAAMCAGLLQLPVLAEDACRYGQEGCTCTEDACQADCAVCHPAEEDAESAETSEDIANAETSEDVETPPAEEDGPAMLLSQEDEAAALRAALDHGESGYTLRDDVTGSFEIPAGKTFTLDLGGHILHGGGADYAIYNKGTLTLENGTVENDTRLGVENYGDLTMNSVTISSNNYTVDLYGGTVSMASCTITSRGMAIYTNPGSAPNLEIFDSKVYGGQRALNQHGTGKVVVDNCALTSGEDPTVEHNAGTLELRNKTSLYVGGELGIIGGKSAKKNVTMDDTVVIDETSKIHTPWTDYVTEVTAADYAVNEAEKTVSISTPMGLAWWAKESANTSFAGYTVRIEDNLDMGGYEWRPIRNGTQYANMTLDGQGHSISNLLAPKVSDYGGGFIGDTDACNFTIKDLTFDHATVGSVGSGNIVGVVMGYLAGTVTMENVRVTNSRVSGGGKVGGLVGQLDNTSAKLILNNCTVKDTIVSGMYNCGGLAGHSLGTVEGAESCTVEATWVPTGNDYVCFVGKADKDLAQEVPLGYSVDAAGTFHRFNNAVSYDKVDYPGLYAAWGSWYTDYQLLFADESPMGPVGIVGLCHPANLHTHINLTGTKYVDNKDGTHTLVCVGCNGELSDKEIHKFGDDNKCEKCGAICHVLTFSWNGGSRRIQVEDGKTAAAPAVPAYTSGDYRYMFRAWSPAFDGTAPVTADAAYTAQYTRTYIGGTGGNPTPNPTPNPNPGGRPAVTPVNPGGSVTITDPGVPLAGGLQLNKTDHFAYIAGYEDGTVRPNNPLTRAQVATIFYRLLTEESRAIYFQETNDFPDVPDDFWACKAISTLTNAGILGGFEDGTFRPNANITRAQFAAMAARFESVTPGLDNPFSDVAGDYWARDLIAYAAFRGWVDGTGAFRPQENITRAEAMDFLNNVLERRVDGEGLAEGYTTFTDVPAGDPWYYVVAEAANTHGYTRREEGQPLENWTGLLENPVWDE